MKAQHVRVYSRTYSLLNRSRITHGSMNQGLSIIHETREKLLSQIINDEPIVIILSLLISYKYTFDLYSFFGWVKYFTHPTICHCFLYIQLHSPHITQLYKKCRHSLIYLFIYFNTDRCFRNTFIFRFLPSYLFCHKILTITSKFKKNKSSCIVYDFLKQNINQLPRFYSRF